MLVFDAEKQITPCKQLPPWQRRLSQFQMHKDRDGRESNDIMFVSHEVLPGFLNTNEIVATAVTPRPDQCSTSASSSSHSRRLGTSDLFREQVHGCMKLPADSVETIMRIDDVCSRPGSFPLKKLLAEALVAQEGDVHSAQKMLDVLQQFATEAEAEATYKRNKTEYKQVTVIVERVATCTDTYSELHCKVLECNAREVKVLILEGPAKGERHKYLFANVRAATPHEASFFQPPVDLGQPPAAASSPAPQAAALPATGGLPPSSLANPSPATGGPSETVSAPVELQVDELWTDGL